MYVHAHLSVRVQINAHDETTHEASCKSTFYKTYEARLRRGETRANKGPKIESRQRQATPQGRRDESKSTAGEALRRQMARANTPRN